MSSDSLKRDRPSGSAGPAETDDDIRPYVRKPKKAKVSTASGDGNLSTSAVSLSEVGSTSSITISNTAAVVESNQTGTGPQPSSAVLSIRDKLKKANNSHLVPQPGSSRPIQEVKLDPKGKETHLLKKIKAPVFAQSKAGRGITDEERQRAQSEVSRKWMGRQYRAAKDAQDALRR
eukprot:GILJ01006739.1.p1 GENE.GILJ01006739.1~~GILJ01006739.1.p1  ORF type:complete len:176 (-),score=21.33 GILJ01006739.1:112-639(-)